MANKMLEYINKSPSPYHAIENLEKRFLEKKGERLYLDKEWKLEKGKLYYLINKDTSLASFYLADDLAKGFNIAASHTDSPNFKIKANPSFWSEAYERINVEVYGGTILYSWLDRPLSLAGMVYIKDGKVIRKVLINQKDPNFIIPSLAIHLNRDVNDGIKFNVQTELCPLFSQKEENFNLFLAKELDCKEEDILSFDLMLYDSYDGNLVGRDKEFISCPRLDNLSMVYAINEGLLKASDSYGRSNISLYYDHEEVGSTSDRGAKSNLLDIILDRVFNSFEAKYISLANSFLISADMAHASHQLFPDKNEPHMRVHLNQGPVIKYSASQSYATSAEAAAYIKVLCKNNNIPYQEFTNRSDVRGGSTIGPMMSAQYGLKTLDIGNPMLAMHSARELAGSFDLAYMVKLFEAFFKI